MYDIPATTRKMSFFRFFKDGSHLGSCKFLFFFFLFRAVSVTSIVLDYKHYSLASCNLLYESRLRYSTRGPNDDQESFYLAPVPRGLAGQQSVFFTKYIIFKYLATTQAVMTRSHLNARG